MEKRKKTISETLRPTPSPIARSLFSLKIKFNLCKREWLNFFYSHIARLNFSSEVEKINILELPATHIENANTETRDRFEFKYFSSFQLLKFETKNLRAQAPKRKDAFEYQTEEFV